MSIYVFHERGGTKHEVDIDEWKYKDQLEHFMRTTSCKDVPGGCISCPFTQPTHGCDRKGFYMWAISRVYKKSNAVDMIDRTAINALIIDIRKQLDKIVEVLNDI